MINAVIIVEINNSKCKLKGFSYKIIWELHSFLICQILSICQIKHLKNQSCNRKMLRNLFFLNKRENRIR